MIKQIKNFRILAGLLLVGLMIGFTSCNKEAELVDVENFTDSTIASLAGKTVGKSTCLEFVFPISIQFVDESIAEVSDYEDLHETIVAWFTANEVEKSRANKPSLIFPIEVLNEDGEIINVETQEALRALKKECPRSGKCKGKKGKGFKCFSLVFPVTLTIGDEDVTFEDRSALKMAVRAYKAEAGDDAERPSLVFPVTVEFDDESTQEVASQEELQALKESCQED